MRIQQALELARLLGVDRLDAQWLLSHLLGQPRTWLLAHDDHPLPEPQQAAFEQGLARRAEGLPLAYVLGQWPFCGMTLEVTPAVLVPRPETEGLVAWAEECLASMPAAAPRVVDLGTGSGAIALALARRWPRAAVSGTDRSAEALAVAAGNGQRLGLAVEWALGDWWVPLEGRCFELAVSNPPYVAGDDPHLAALGHEPRGALTPEGDGLAALRQIVAQAPRRLVPGAWLLLEHGHDQGPAVQGLLSAAGFAAIATRTDLAGLPRCSGGRWPDAK